MSSATTVGGLGDLDEGSGGGGSRVAGHGSSAARREASFRSMTRGFGEAAARRRPSARPDDARRAKLGGARQRGDGAPPAASRPGRRLGRVGCRWRRGSLRRPFSASPSPPTASKLVTPSTARPPRQGKAARRARPMRMPVPCASASPGEEIRAADTQSEAQALVAEHGCHHRHPGSRHGRAPHATMREARRRRRAPPPNRRRRWSRGRGPSHRRRRAAASPKPRVMLRRELPPRRRRAMSSHPASAASACPRRDRRGHPTVSRSTLPTRPSAIRPDARSTGALPAISTATPKPG